MQFSKGYQAAGGLDELETNIWLGGAILCLAKPN